MTNRFWLLGANDSLEVVGERVSRALALELRPHESGYRGGNYLRGDGPLVPEVVVQTNFEDEEGYLAEAEFPEFSVLIYVTQSLDGSRLDWLASEGLQVLRVEEL